MSFWEMKLPNEIPPYPLSAGSWFAPPPPTLRDALVGNLYVRYRTAVRKPFERRLDLIEKPLVQTFINCRTGSQLLEFMNDFAIPIWDRGSSAVPLNFVEGFRTACAGVMDLYQEGQVEEAAKLLSPDLNFADLRPVLSFVRGKRVPVFTLKVFSLSAFLCLELGSIIAGGATVKNCLNCGNMFVAGSATGRRTTSFYCSNRCRVAYQRRAEQVPGGTRDANNAGP
jgi:hypothetical protein